MARRVEQAVQQVTAGQFGLVTLAQARHAGLTTRQVEDRVRSGTWIRYHSRVFRLAGSPDSPHARLLAACLAAGGEVAASHFSALWLLGLESRAPERPVITVAYRQRPRLHGVEVHRSRDLDGRRTLLRGAVPYTDALRAISDAWSVAGAERLEPIVDRALATKMVTAEGLMLEAERRNRPGRRGQRALRSWLIERGFAGGPAPSVLEAETLRLLRLFGIPVLSRELTVMADGRYRIDFLIESGLAVEVDGYLYHWSPEAKAYDDSRRNRLRLQGLTVLVYSWRDIRLDGRRVAAEIRAALGNGSLAGGQMPGGGAPVGGQMLGADVHTPYRDALVNPTGHGLGS